MEERTGIKYLRSLSDEEFHKLNARLLAYAKRLVGGYLWKTGKKKLPDGMNATDLAYSAIEKVFTGESDVYAGGRVWDPESTPDFVDYLKSIVKSNLWARTQSSSSKNTPDVFKNTDTDEITFFSLFESAESTDAEVNYLDLKEKVEDEIQDHPELIDVYLAMTDGIRSTSALCQKFDISRREMDKRKRQIRKIVDKYITH